MHDISPGHDELACPAPRLHSSLARLIRWEDFHVYRATSDCLGADPRDYVYVVPFGAAPADAVGLDSYRTNLSKLQALGEDTAVSATPVMATLSVGGGGA